MARRLRVDSRRAGPRSSTVRRGGELDLPLTRGKHRLEADKDLASVRRDRWVGEIEARERQPGRAVERGIATLASAVAGELSRYERDEFDRDLSLAEALTAVVRGDERESVARCVL